MNQRKRVVILGAGFAGISVAGELARLLTKSSDCDVTLVDQNNYSLFTPMLTEVIGGDLDAEDVVISVRKVSPRIAFIQGRTLHVDLEHRQVTVEVGDSAMVTPTTRTLEADHLVFALGSDPNFHHISGLEENSLTVKSVRGAIEIRNAVLTLLERANVEAEPQGRRKILTFVVGGGGFSGVETMAALNGLVREAAQEYGALSESNIRTILIHPGDRLLPEIGEKLAKFAQKALTNRGVTVALKTKVVSASKGSVAVEPAVDGETEIPAGLFIWAGGVKPSGVVERSGGKIGHHGGLVVDACMRLPDHPGCWALGDCAEIPKKGGGTYAPTAQDATREGKLLARNLVAVMQEQEPQPFIYSSIGELALVGKRSGVATLYGIHISGFLAWAMWRSVYLAKMPRLGNRFRVASHWLTDLIFGRETVTVNE